MSNVLYELITDRASAETYYNVSDLNRVETATKLIGEYMNKAGYTVSIREKSTGQWTIKDIPTDMEMDRYLSNLINIRKQMNKIKEPLPSSMSTLTYEDANNIERLLQFIDEVLLFISIEYRRCGETICGHYYLLNDADFTPYLDYFGILTWIKEPPHIDANGILDMTYATFKSGILQDL